jgi:putative acyl-CoA dehydrogenase
MPGHTTHEVTNQPPPLQGYDVYGADAALREAVEREGAGWAADDLSALGRQAGDPAWIARGVRAEANRPVLRTHDRYGNRIDEVEFDPAWHELMDVAVRNGLHGGPWADKRPGAHVARAAGHLVWGQVDPGVCCPVTMTYASVAALRLQPEIAAVWEPAITTTAYDPGLRPVADKAGVVVGMGMTEKQGGSDVRSGTTLAVPQGAGGPGAAYSLTGHKWFCSAPMSDAFLVLAGTPAGVSCFLLPRVLPDGTRNAFAIQRLKDKLGNRSNASSEVEFQDSTAFLLGEEGRGVPLIAAMVNLTRLDCILGTAGIVRQAVAQAVHHARHRRAFGALLADQPLMTAVLADLAVESEAATALAIRLAGAVDRTEQAGAAGQGAQPGAGTAPGPHELALRRLGTAVGKYWVCKRGPATVAEALECLGGNGYVEDSGMPRLYREAPLNSIWEGSGNVNVLDVLRAIGRDPAAADAYLAEVELARGGDARLDAHATALRAELAALPAALADGGAAVQRGARGLVERMAVALQGSLLVRHAPAGVADLFCATRLGGGGWAFGTQPADVPASAAAAIVARHAPEV